MKRKVILSVLIAITLVIGSVATCGAVSREYFKSGSQTQIRGTEVFKQSWASYDHVERYYLRARVDSIFFGTILADTGKVRSYYPSTVKSKFVWDRSLNLPSSTIARAFYGSY